MSALAALEEDEAYLLAILDDPTGIDLAEFAFVDEESEDRCYRVWDYQWSLYTDASTYQIDQCGRSLGKSQGIIMRSFAFPFSFPGQELLITAPELNHLRPIVDKVEALFTAGPRFAREMLPKVKGGGINHQPQFQARFNNNARIVSRLPNRDGKGVKGQHPLRIEMDEAQDYPAPGWTEIIETMKAGSVGAQWRAHGVSRGVRDMYYQLTMGENPDLPFFVHKYMAPHRATWSTDERRAKLAMYGGTEENVDYRRNIFGEHGDAHNPLFVLARLMACVRINESAWASTYNDEVYYRVKINDELHRRTGVAIENFLLDVPATHLQAHYTSYWAGMDVGYTADPTEILIFGTTTTPAGDVDRLLTRVQLARITASDQAAVVRHLFGIYGPRLRRWGMDKTGNGLPLWQNLREEVAISERIAGYGFSEKLPVAFDDRAPVGREGPADLTINQNVIDYATDCLRIMVDTKAVELPYDTELLTEWQGQAVVVVKDSGSAAGMRKKYSGGSCHTLSAAQMYAAAKSLQAMEAALATPARRGPVLEAFL